MFFWRHLLSAIRQHCYRERVMFIKADDGRYKCDACGLTINLPRNVAPEKIICGRCGGAGTSVIEPGLISQGWNYTKAVAGWMKAGSPTRTKSEIDRIFAICQLCPQFISDDLRPRCRVCGCSLSQAPEGLNNKIAMATESCPLDPPKWTAIAP